MGGNRYVVSFSDRYSHFPPAYFINYKAEVLEYFGQFCIYEGVPKRNSFLTLRSDDRGEYHNKASDEICFAQGTKKEMTAFSSPHRIGAAERR